MDAAFKASLGLYRVGLVNDQLLSLPNYDEDAAKTNARVVKRPAVTAVELYPKLKFMASLAVYK